MVTRMCRPWKVKTIVVCTKNKVLIKNVGRNMTKDGECASTRRMNTTIGK